MTAPSSSYYVLSSKSVLGYLDLALEISVSSFQPFLWPVFLRSVLVQLPFIGIRSRSLNNKRMYGPPIRSVSHVCFCEIPGQRCGWVVLQVRCHAADVQKLPSHTRPAEPRLHSLRGSLQTVPADMLLQGDLSNRKQKKYNGAYGLSCVISEILRRQIVSILNGEQLSIIG